MSMINPHAFLGISRALHGANYWKLATIDWHYLNRTQSSPKCMIDPMNAPLDLSINLYGDGNSSDIIAEAL